MDREKFLTGLYPLIGGKDNTSLCDFQDGTLYVTLKDAGLADETAVAKLPDIASATLRRGRLTITFGTPEQKEEVPFMANDKQIAADVLRAVGGKENVTGVAHCMTRLRFNLKNMDLPNQDEVKAIPGVLGVTVGGGQFQVIIGQNVPKVYAEVCSLGGFSAQAAIDENLDKPKEKLTLKKVGSNILDYLAGSITPLIPIMLGAAMFKTVATILGSTMLGWIADGSSLAILLDFVYDAGFYFFPVYLGYTAAKKLNTSIPIGLFLGGILLAPDFAALVGAETPFTVFDIPCTVNDYSSSVMPILLSVWVMSYIYKFISKHMPTALSTVFTPFLTILIMLPIMLCALAPLGNYIGQYLALFLSWLASVGGGLAVGVVAAAYCFMVMTGMHVPLVVMSLTTLFSTGSDSLLFVGASCATSACCGMALGAFLKLKDKNEKSLSMGYLVTCLLSGITEPSLYGIGIKYKGRPFIGLAVGAFAGGLFAGLMKVTFHVLISVTVLVPLCFAAGGTSNMINGTIANIIALIVAAVVTYLFGFDRKKD